MPSFKEVRDTYYTVIIIMPIKGFLILLLTVQVQTKSVPAKPFNGKMSYQQKKNKLFKNHTMKETQTSCWSVLWIHASAQVDTWLIQLMGSYNRT